MPSPSSQRQRRNRHLPSRAVQHHHRTRVDQPVHRQRHQPPRPPGLTVRPHQGVSVLIRRHRSDRRNPDHHGCGRPPDDTLGSGHRPPPTSSRANSRVSKHGFFGAVAPRTHHGHELTCGYAIGAALEAQSSRSFMQVRAMGVQVGFRSRNDNNTLRPRRTSKLRFNGRSPLTGHRKPAQAPKRCQVIAASAVTRLSGCLPPDLVRARVSPTDGARQQRRHPAALPPVGILSRCRGWP